MAMNAGTVSIDATTGDETYTPDDATNAAKPLYLALVSDNTTITRHSKIPGGKATATFDPVTKKLVVTPPPAPTLVTETITQDLYHPTQADVDAETDPTQKAIKKGRLESNIMTRAKLASTANLFAAWIVPYIQANAEITTTIPATSDGDGLQTGQGTGNPTTHPATAKTLTGSIT